MRIKFIFDLIFVLILLPIMVPLGSIIAIAIRMSSPGPVVYWSERIGRNNEIFLMPKFRTMKIGVPEVATHLLHDADEWVTPIGAFLRKTSLDELPQLWSILAGDMSFVGPRPALFNQEDLKILRTRAGVHVLTPGLTGWAQVKGRDELNIEEKLKFDIEYLERCSIGFDVCILFLTCASVIKRDGVSH